MTWSRGLVTGFLLAGVLLFTVACNPDGTSSQPNGNVIFNQTQTSHGCTGSQTVTVQNGDTLTVLVENHVSGSFSVEQVVNIVADTNGIANRNVIRANQQIRLPRVAVARNRRCIARCVDSSGVVFIVAAPPHTVLVAA